MMCVKIFFVCVFVCMLSLIALAGGGKNPDSCAGVGSVLVHCYECRDDTKRYLGKVAVLTGYEEAQGEKFCVRAADARTACSQAFGVSTHVIGFYTKYKMGLGESEEYYNTSCVKQVGKP
jgi:hypothetical protein